MAFLLGILLCGLAAFLFVLGITYVVGTIQANKDPQIVALRAELKESKARLKKSEANLNIAEKGLRQIANGVSGNPALDSQVALEDISNNE